jgi:hypothetical protein
MLLNIDTSSSQPNTTINTITNKHPTSHHHHQLFESKTDAKHKTKVQ